MQFRLLSVPLVALAFVAAGCGTPPSSAEDFQGDERAVAETVEDIQRAAERDETDRICRDFLTEELAEQVAASGSTCQEQLQKAVDDADVFELEVEEVTLDGPTDATATVRGDNEPADPVREFTLELGGTPERWRVASFGDGA